MPINTDLAVAIQIVQCDELLGQGMLIRCDVPSEDRQTGIAIGFWKIAEYLIVSAIFFNNVDDVLDGRHELTLSG